MWLKSHFPDFTGLSAINLGFLSKADLKLAIDQSDDVANNDNKDLSKFSAQNISISNKQKKKLSIEVTFFKNGYSESNLCFHSFLLEN